MRDRPPLIVWFTRPPKVSRGSFNYVSQAWGNRVLFVYHKGYKEERKKLDWEYGDFGAAEMINLSDHSDRSRIVRDIFVEFRDAIHIFAGFDRPVRNRLNEFIRYVPNGKIGVFSERPGVYGSKIKRKLKRMIVPLKQLYFRLKYNSSVAVYMPLGSRGVDTAIHFGWPEQKLFPFMYCPEEPPVSVNQKGDTDVRGVLKFIYVGRFSRVTKGVDTLISAVERIRSNGWTLTLVGGYGDMTDETIDWAKDRDNVEFVGSWSFSNVRESISEFDICVVPSRFDGWNVVVNEALSAGIGVIATDQAVSDELVLASGAGLVVEANNSRRLALAMKIAIENPSIVNHWKSQAKAYRERISPESVGNYFINVLDHVFLSDDSKVPKCPWI